MREGGKARGTEGGKEGRKGRWREGKREGEELKEKEKVYLLIRPHLLCHLTRA